MLAVAFVCFVVRCLGFGGFLFGRFGLFCWLFCGLACLVVGIGGFASWFMHDWIACMSIRRFVISFGFGLNRYLCALMCYIWVGCSMCFVGFVSWAGWLFLWTCVTLFRDVLGLFSGVFVI